ncbi:hypothetical protein CR513_24442, partial [Mucuna pruriens]
MPTSVQEALKDENWVQAMKEEMKVLEKNLTWEIVDRLNDKRVVDLEEEVYMEIPRGFYSHNKKNKSPRAWFGRFAQVMISLGYRQSQGDHTLFIKHSTDGKLTLLLVYVDDMIVRGVRKAKILSRDRSCMFQKKYLYLSKKLCTRSPQRNKKIGMQDLGGVPIEQNHRIECEESPPIEKSQY